MNFISRLTILPRWVISLIDALILFVSAFFAFLVRFNFEWDEIESHDFVLRSAVFTVGAVLVLQLTNSQEGIVRHTGFRDGLNIFKSIGINFISFLALTVFLRNGLAESFFLPISVLIIASLFSLVSLIFYRLMVKELYANFKNGITVKPFKNVVIFGAGEAGVIALEAIKRDSKSNFNTIAFLDDNPKKEGKHINRMRIFKGLNELLHDPVYFPVGQGFFRVLESEADGK